MVRIVLGSIKTAILIQLDSIRSIDIDNEEDFEMAELALEALKIKKINNREIKYWEGFRIFNF